MDSDIVHSDRRLTKQEFRKLVVQIADALPGPEESFEYLVNFMHGSIKLSMTEQLRGSCRRRWLVEMQQAIITTGLSLENVFRAAFQAIYKDAELHGGRKQVNVYVALAERVPENERLTHGDGICLRYVAATPKDSPIVLNKRLYSDMSGVSLTVIESGRPIHVPSIGTHGNIHFWNPDQKEGDGSLLVLPLKETSRKQVFGVLAVDTLGDPQNLTMGGVAGAGFTGHEIKFYQGVAAALADAFRVVQHAVDLTNQLAKAVPIVFEQVDAVLQCTIYLTEIDPRTSWIEPKDEAEGDVVLRKIIEATRSKSKTEQIGTQPARLLREQNVFREYVFNCAASGMTVAKRSYGERKIAVPLRRPSDGKTVAVFDLGVRDPGKERTIVRDDGTVEKRAPPLLPSTERIKLVRVLRALQAAVGQLSMEFLTHTDGVTVSNPKILHPPGGQPCHLLVESPKFIAKVPEATKIAKDIMIYRALLGLHRSRLRRYPDCDVFADLKSIGRPKNPLVQRFTAQLIGLVYPRYYAELHQDWIHCKVVSLFHFIQFEFPFFLPSTVSNNGND